MTRIRLRLGGVVLASLVAVAVGVVVAVPTAAPAVAPEGLECLGGFNDFDHEPVLLVHGTFTNGWEHWGWNWYDVLAEEGFDVCIITLPDRSFGDMQPQGEIVADAIRHIAASTGDQVDVLGHSQGALHPRWAVKWWPDVRASVDDMVMLAGPQHGTQFGGSGESPFGCFESCWQMMPPSQYLAALNAPLLGEDDETPGDIDYTSIYTAFDELVQPQVPESTSALSGGTNLLIQDVCPGRPVEHVFMMVDGAVEALVRDAFVNPGAADVERAGGLVGVCSRTVMEEADPAGHAADIMARDFQEGFPNFHPSETEPPLRCYAGGACP